MNVAVSAYSTDLGIDSRGAIEFPPTGGGDFFPEAIPIGRLSDELPSAEAAVVLAAAVPELVAPFYGVDDPLEARWHIRLESPARIRTAVGTTVESAEVYVSRIRTTNRPGSRMWNADAVQPAEVDVLWIPMARVGENWDEYVRRREAEMRTLHVTRRPEMPINFTAGVIAP